ncbi:MFS transporter [Conexibacter stalactiti]|uniref:MFS transporter n=1 Tax=Conexibacter stalactiti TaxID=1940611 RepID=A0ABU4HYN5_9ACTN|nr:MFS transporter [Conexibacter stalactiti]MDW5598443.1 MFS transporter [Conexibacter stalactiti]MEC5039085.1 MFS transporter [Conexibacter stalactiti]
MPPSASPSASPLAARRAAAPPRQRRVDRRTLAIATACAGGFLAFLDTTIVNTAFPSIAGSFGGATLAQLSWVLDAYFIVLAALLVPAGGLADRLGRKRVFLAGTLLFVTASVLCAAAPSWQVLVAARVVQGVGAAIVVPVSLALILPEFPVAKRAAAVGMWGASAALAAAGGPALGGLLSELADWRLVFLVNVPLGLLVWAMARRSLVESVDERATGLPDLAGSALAVAGLGLLALALVEGGNWGWTSAPIVASAVAAGVLLAATARRCATHPRPIVDPKLMRIPSFARANLGLLLLGMGFFSTILANILFLTSVWSYGILTAGLAVVPGAIASAVAAIPAGKLADRHGHRAVIVPGCLLYVAGILVVRTAGAEPDFLGTWLPAMVLNGIGLGMSFPTLGAAALRDVRPERFASASAISSAFRQFGGVLGTAILFAVLGSPVGLGAALDAFHEAYLVSALWPLGAALAALTLAPRAAAAPADADADAKVVTR